MTDLREAVARAICKTGRFETGEGACAVLCMEALGCARRSCGHVERIHGKMADAVLATIRERHVIVERVAPADLPKHLAEEVEGDLASLCLDEWLDDSAINALRGRMLGRVLAARSAALEEAAKVAEGNAAQVDLLALQAACDDSRYAWASAQLQIARQIRALIGGTR